MEITVYEPDLLTRLCTAVAAVKNAPSIGEGAFDQLSAVAAEMTVQWRNTCFSAIADPGLKRYFNYHLAGLSRIVADLNPAAAGSLEVASVVIVKLLELIDHLFEHYGTYLNREATAPHAYRRRLSVNLARRTGNLIRHLQRAAISPALGECLIAYLNVFSAARTDFQLTYLALQYFENMVQRLEILFEDKQLTELQLNRVLYELNFNHLSYYAYRQQAYRIQATGLTPVQKLKLYAGELTAINEQPQQTNLIYDRQWPDLKTMINAFLNEEMSAMKEPLDLKNNIAGPFISKIPLNLSVAHLACLIRLLFEGGCFGELNLQDLFRFFALHFRTKRQDQVSNYSLSKEYYSIDQVTAAVMRDKLLKMVAWINQTFFPV